MSAHTQDLSQGHPEALHALLNSLSVSDAAPGASGAAPAITPEHAKVISTKLDALLGGADAAPSQSTQPVTEDGLPIIEISEPARADAPPAAPPVEPLGPVLSESERAARRREMHRLLDALEDEERADTARAAAPAPDPAQLAAQRALQKKMGKALLRNIADAREAAVSAQAAEAAAWDAHRAADSGRRPRKTVSWAELPRGTAGETKAKARAPSPGDVARARLAPAPAPMRMGVVERAAPAAPDSDDESDPPDSDATLSDTDNDDDGAGYKPDFAAALEDDGVDFDAAQHQREVALRYYEARATVGAQVYAEMTAAHGDRHEWDQPEVPLDATLAHAPPKPAVSRFKAGRAEPMRAHVPAVQRAVRTGKLEGGKLVGPADDSGSDADDAELVGMLARGELTNLGPEPASIPGPGPSTQAGRERATLPRLGELAQGLPQGGSPLATPVNTTERSSPKMGAAALPGPPAPERRPVSAQVAERRPVSAQVTERTPASRGTPIAVPSRHAKPPDRGPAPVVEYPAQTSVMPSMVVDSPSFPPPGAPAPAPVVQAPRKTSRFMLDRS